MQQRLVTLCGMVVVLLFGFAAEGGLTIEEAENLSQQTGRPILAVVGRSSCGNTTAFMKDLSDRALAPALSQYVNVTIDADKPEWDTWYRKYGAPKEATSLPFVYVLRSDGEKISLSSGYMETPEVRKLVMTQASKAGRVLSAQELASMDKALEAAKQADAKDDIGAGIKALSSVKKLGVMGGAACYAKPVVEANSLVAEWTEKGRARLKEAHEQLASGEAKFDAALAYVRVKRTFALLPDLKKELSAARKIEQNRKLTELLRQADAIDRAQVLAATRDGRKKAADAFSRIVTANPNTEAATFASDELKKLEKADEGSAAESKR